MRFLTAILLSTLLGACAQGARQGGDIVVIGDSVMAWNRAENADVGSVIGSELNRNVVNRAAFGAQINANAFVGFIGLSVPDQLPRGRWNWVVVNGAANDLGFSCGCTRCGQEIDLLISSDGTSGAIPDLFQKARTQGARVLWLGYYEAPETTSFEGCRPGLVEIERRIEKFAKSKRWAFFLDAEDIFDPTDSKLFDSDRTHPSIRGSDLIGKQIAQIIARADQL